MKIPKYIRKRILYREKLQLKSNEIQADIEKWFEKHNIEVEWKNTHVAFYVEPTATKSMYLRTLEEKIK